MRELVTVVSLLANSSIAGSSSPGGQAGEALRTVTAPRPAAVTWERATRHDSAAHGVVDVNNATNSHAAILAGYMTLAANGSFKQPATYRGRLRNCPRMSRVLQAAFQSRSDSGIS
jgi:hypothetical protein